VQQLYRLSWRIPFFGKLASQSTPGYAAFILHHQDSAIALNPTKGFGFIVPDEGGADAFVHISAVERAGLSTLNEGQRVNFELQDGRNGKKSAENISVAD